MSRRPAILAVDGGGSKIDAVLVRRDGTVLGAARIAAGEFGESGGEAHMSQVIDAVVAACADAERRASSASRSLISVSTAWLEPTSPSTTGGSARWLRSRTGGPATTSSATTPSRSCGPGPTARGASASSAASGPTARAWRPTGGSYRFPAVGPISGDWGGGAEIGEAGLWYAIRAEDGRGEKTTLTRLVPEHFGLRRPKQVMEALYLGRIDEARTAELAPVVFRAADRGRRDRSEHRRPAGRRDRGDGGDGDPRLRMTAARRRRGARWRDLPQRVRRRSSTGSTRVSGPSRPRRARMS